MSPNVMPEIETEQISPSALLDFKWPEEKYKRRKTQTEFSANQQEQSDF